MRGKKERKLGEAEKIDHHEISLRRKERRNEGWGGKFLSMVQF